MIVVPRLSAVRAEALIPYLIEAIAVGLLSGDESFEIFVENLDIVCDFDNIPENIDIAT